MVERFGADHNYLPSVLNSCSGVPRVAPLLQKYPASQAASGAERPVLEQNLVPSQRVQPASETSPAGYLSGIVGGQGFKGCCQ